MITDKVQQLQSLRAKLAQLEQQVATARAKQFAALPALYGFGSTDEFIAAVRAAADGRRGRPTGLSKPAAKARGGRRRRAKITDVTRAAVKKLVQAGKTGNEIAKTLKISLPSVQNIKSALGLVQKRKK